MNGFPAERSPVLAWNVEPFQAPFPEMAAAAISPVVHPPHDPYATRSCWQGQVDAGTCFPYFGTLYSSSLPSSSYRVQPGCVSNLGQFWPPTPPPDGCGRYETSNNLYFCPPLTPVFRHGESIAQNIRGNYSRLGHYSNLVEVHKDSSLHSHGFKQESSDSPKGNISYMTVCPTVSKSDSVANSCHSDSGLKSSDSSLDSAQKQDSFFVGKRQRNAQHKSCHCYECSARNCTKVLTKSVDKENIRDSSPLVEQKCSEERLKTKNCGKSKDDSSGVVLYKNSAYPPNSSAIRNFNCSTNPPVTQASSLSDNIYQSEDIIAKNLPRNSDSVIERSSSVVQYNFQRADNIPPQNNRCSSNSMFTIVSSGDATLSSQSVVNAPTHSKIPSSMEKLQHGLQMSTPGYDACPCTPSQFHMRSNSQPGEKNCCFSPSYPMSRTLYPSSSESTTHNQEPSSFVVYGNNLTASPLKNVYFSHIESENVNLASSADRSHVKNSCERQEKFCNFNPLGSGAASSERRLNYPSFSTADNFNKVYSLSKNTYPNQYQTRPCTVPNICERNVHSTIFDERKNEFSSCSKSVRDTNLSPKEMPVFPAQLSKMGPVHIKREKTENVGCKFQKSNSRKCSKIPQLHNFSETSDALNLSTSIGSLKSESNDIHYRKVHKNVEQRWNPASSRTFFDSTKNFALGLQVPELNMSSIPTKSMNGYFFDIPAFNHFEKSHFKIPKAASVQPSGVESFCPPTVPGDLISIAQTAPCETEFVNSSSKTQNPDDCNKSKKNTFIPAEISHDVPIRTPKPTSRIVATATCQHRGAEGHKENPQLHYSKQSLKKNEAENDILILKQNSTLEEGSDKVVPVSNQNVLLSNQLKKECNSTNLEVSQSNAFQDAMPVLRTPISNSSSIIASKALPINIKVESECDSDHISKVASFPIQGIKTEACDTAPEPMDIALSLCAENKELLQEEMDISVSVSGFKVKEEEPVCSDTESIVESKEQRNDFMQSEESVPISDPKEYNGLYLLLHSIEHINTFEKECNAKENNSTMENGLCNTKTDSERKHRCENDIKIEQFSALSKIESSNMHGLNLLCALAEHHFALDGYDKHTDMTNECDLEDKKLSTIISSNYPVIKEENLSLPSFQEMSSPQSANEGYNAAELEMRTKLAELQKKYKEKQKELARLKSKKLVTNKYIRRNNGRACKKSSQQDSSLSECSSEGSCFHSDTTSSPNTSLRKEKNQECAQSVKNETVVDGITQNEVSISQVTEKAKEVSQDSNDVCDDKSRSSSRSDSLSFTKSSEYEPAVRRQLVLRSRCRDVIVTDYKIGKNCRNKSSLSNFKSKKTVPKSRASKLCSKDNGTPAGSSAEMCSNDAETAFDVKDAGRMRSLSKSKETRMDLNPTSNFKPTVISNIVQGGTSSKVSNKRKPDNPKKCVPAKKGRLTETIVAKQLRNRILFETANYITDGDQCQKDNSVPQELFDAMRKCHLGEGSESYNCVKHNSELLKSAIFSSEDDIPLSLLSKGSTLDKKSSKVSVCHLVQNQRVLAMEDGLFYAGFIKEIRSPDVYGIVRDGQRGNKQHLFTQEQMLTETILELKPSSMSELNEGTRVCAYWSQPYRYLYPGTVVKAPTPSVDWSEPRVFVEFDDGDSGQIPIKNIRLLPADMPCFFADDDSKHNELYASGFDSVKCALQLDGHDSERKRKKGRAKVLRKRSRLSKKEHSKKRNSSRHDNHEVSPSESCGNESPASSSQSLEHPCMELDFPCAESSEEKTKKTLRRQSKRRSEIKSKLSLFDVKNKMEKNKKHRKYKDRHKHHHHHHHHHHRHCHRHHHCKKHKHRRKTNCNIMYEDCYETGAIPSTSIPRNLSTKSTRNSSKATEDYVKHSGHSKKAKLPQSAAKVAPLQSIETKSVVSSVICTESEQSSTSRKASSSVS